MMCEHLTPLALDGVLREPLPSQSIYRDECTQCFATDEDDDGILLCITCFNGGCRNHALQHSLVSGHGIALRICKKVIPSVCLLGVFV